MHKKPANNASIDKILEAVRHPERIITTRQALNNMMSHDLTIEDICDEVIYYIESNGEVQETRMRGDDAGVPAFEMFPEINQIPFYVKVLFRTKSGDDEDLVVISAHP